MGVIAAAVKHMLAANMPADAIIAAVAEMEASLPKDEQAELRRAKDRERKRLRNSAESAETMENGGKETQSAEFRGICGSEEKENSPQTPLQENTPPKEKPPKGGQKKRGNRLSEDWTLPSEYREWAISQGFPASSIDGEAARFRDHWIAKSGNDACKVDWSATWRNWIRNAERFGNVRRGQATSQSPPVNDYIQLLNHNQASRSAVIAKLRRWFVGQMTEWRYTPAWSDDHPPGHPDCVIPPDIIAEAQTQTEAEIQSKAG